ncbi:amino acid transporter, partial [Streptomyces sp. SID7803]|nr:amino acid transporter [Streptomyces sp. SID7803]
MTGDDVLEILDVLRGGAGGAEVWIGGG